jgi:hypothetical protein
MNGLGLPMKCGDHCRNRPTCKHHPVFRWPSDIWVGRNEAGLCGHETQRGGEAFKAEQDGFTKHRILGVVFRQHVTDTV